MTEPHPQVARARALQPLLTREGDEVNRRRELTPPIVGALKDGNFFRMLQPRSVGGMELKPSDFSQVTEAIAAADGSTGWVVCQSNGCAMSAAYLDPRGGQGDVRPCRRDPGLGAGRFAVRSRAGRWRLLHLRHMALRQRLPERRPGSAPI